MPYTDLREFLAALEGWGLLRHVQAEVDKDWELSAVSRWVYIGFPEDQRFAVMYDRVKGFDMPVVVGAIGASYKTYAVALGIDPRRPRAEVMGEMRRRWDEALDHPLGARLVSTGPCKERILTGSEVDLHRFPVPVWTPEKDRGWDRGFGFITSPYCVTKDPETKVRNVGTYRMMIREEPNVVGIAGTMGAHIWHHIKKNEDRGMPTEIAAVIGADPTIGMTSTTEVPSGIDEFAVSGRLRGEPVELVKCETVDLEVPATAEIVIEGRLPPAKERPYEAEAPFGEYTGYQGSAKFSPVFEVSCITCRRDAVYQGFISQMPPSESSKLRHIAYEALILRSLKAVGVEGIVDINMPETAQVGFIIVSIQKMDEGHPARIANALLSVLQPRWGKFIVVTDDDVDVYDLDNVLWAITFRTSLTPNRRKLYCYEGMNAQALDYSAAPSLEEVRDRWDWPSAVVVIDATRPYVPYPVTSMLPAKYLERARERWAHYGLPDLIKADLPRCVKVEEEYLRRGLAAYPQFIPMKRG